MNDKAVSSAREEVQEARMRIEGLTYQLSALQKQVRLHNLLSATTDASVASPN